jgi:DNA topoisomerase-1
MEDTPETNGHVDPGVSLRFGPVKSAADVDMQDASDANTGIASKRKARTSVGQRKSYAEPESSEDEDQPLVRRTSLRRLPRFP